MHLVGLALLTCVFSGESTDALVCEGEFIRSPGLLRTTENGTVIFRWRTRSKVTAYFGVSLKYGDREVLSFYRSGTIILSDDYIDRAAGGYDGRDLEVTLSGVTLHDTDGQFTLEIVDFEGQECGDVTEIFIYKPPSIPKLKILRSTEDDEVIITCQADSTSVPTKHRQPISYTWAIGGENSGAITPSDLCSISGENNETLRVRDAGEVGDGVVCIARENGSPLSSQTIVDISNKGQANSYQVVLFLLLGVVAVAIGAAVVYWCWHRRMSHRAGVQTTEPNTHEVLPQATPDQSPVDENTGSELYVRVKSDTYDEINEYEIQQHINKAKYPAPGLMKRVDPGSTSRNPEGKDVMSSGNEDIAEEYLQTSSYQGLGPQSAPPGRALYRQLTHVDPETVHEKQQDPAHNQEDPDGVDEDYLTTDG